MRHIATAWRLLLADPRHGQIATLATLLAYGLAFLEFDLTLPQVIVTIGSTVLVQAVADRWTGRDKVSGAKSANCMHFDTAYRSSVGFGGGCLHSGLVLYYQPGRRCALRVGPSPSRRSSALT